ncbi:APC family permease [Mycobacteroides franklinii]|uniref:Amino acid permease n=1 Tax=Mycobacteroides franklinii TaxID=948102 RepID=A0A4R5P434_9MYCO|nr:amino acid permease [Mycobacteroides franklinii]ORA58745.1 amino acid permease [Mycobacteroides franklinii]TDH17685.1 amino acid permease [Mycobacteroides franklinii]TDZ43225.1 putative amino acid permease YhdG [Mycobacteroides franklinii]TDZ50360.1 putative amino acid permease YhdG [Mycobacteroides franklinii]TDZ56780.1 putative amino acid permease YhdG [Mycobacteroides franklinii]
MPGSGLWRTKSVEQSIADTDEPETKLRRDLTWWDLTVFGVSVVIGAGIFTVTASTAANVTGPAISLSFIMAAIGCGLAAMCYAEFASTIPVAGSAYTFSYATFGEFAAWILGWDLILEFSVGAATVAKGWSSYLSTVFGFSSGTVHLGSVKIDWGALLVVSVLTVLLAVGTKLSSRVSLVITTIKVLVVLLVIIVGAFFIKTSNYTPFIPPAEAGGSSRQGLDQSLFSFIVGGTGSQYGWFGVLAGASIVFFAFIGFDVVATTAEETRNPQKDVPRGIIASLVIVTVLYVAVTVVLSGMVKYSDLRAEDSHPNLSTAFHLNGVDWAAKVIAIGALAGLTTVVMVLMLGQIRVIFAMCRDGLLPRELARTGSHGTPIRITLIVGFLVAMAASLTPIEGLEEIVNVGTLFAFVLVSAGVVVLRRSRPDLPRSFRTPGVPWLPIVAIVACGWLMLNLAVRTWMFALGWMAVGVIVYFVYSRRHSVLGQRVAVEK